MKRSVKIQNGDKLDIVSDSTVEWNIISVAQYLDTFGPGSKFFLNSTGQSYVYNFMYTQVVLTLSACCVWVNIPVSDHHRIPPW